MLPPILTYVLCKMNDILEDIEDEVEYGEGADPFTASGLNLYFLCRMDDLLEDREDNVEDVEAVDPFAASGLNLPGLKGPGLLGTLDRYQKQKMQKLCFAKIRICTA